MLIEDFGVPVPGETVLILAAVYAGTGRLNIVLVALLGFRGALLGDNIGFAIGHFGGRPLAERYGRYVFLTPERLDKATGFFDRHGGKIIIVARFIEGLRQANGIIAGTSGMRWARFLASTRSAPRCGSRVWTSIGYFSGSHIDTIYRQRLPLQHLPGDRRRRAPGRLHHATHRAASSAPCRRRSGFWA